jgi:hypothetical protein
MADAFIAGCLYDRLLFGRAFMAVAFMGRTHIFTRKKFKNYILLQVKIYA